MLGLFYCKNSQDLEPDGVIKFTLSGIFFTPMAKQNSKSEEAKMKDVQRTINEKKIKIYLVDKDLEDQIDRVLKTKDDKLIDSYFLLIHEQQLKDRANTRRHQSLELSIESGHQFVDDSASLEDILIEKEEKIEMQKKLCAAMKTLNEDQKWLINQIYVLGRNQSEIAEELGVVKQAINNRLERILKKIKKFCN